MRRSDNNLMRTSSENTLNDHVRIEPVAHPTIPVILKLSASDRSDGSSHASIRTKKQRKIPTGWAGAPANPRSPAASARYRLKPVVHGALLKQGAWWYARNCLSSF